MAAYISRLNRNAMLNCIKTLRGWHLTFINVIILLSALHSVFWATCAFFFASVFSLLPFLPLSLLTIIFLLRALINFYGEHSSNLLSNLYKNFFFQRNLCKKLRKAELRLGPRNDEQSRLRWYKERGEQSASADTHWKCNGG